MQQRAAGVIDVDAHARIDQEDAVVALEHRVGGALDAVGERHGDRLVAHHDVVRVDGRRVGRERGRGVGAGLLPEDARREFVLEQRRGVREDRRAESVGVDAGLQRGREVRECETARVAGVHEEPIVDARREREIAQRHAERVAAVGGGGGRQPGVREVAIEAIGAGRLRVGRDPRGTSASWLPIVITTSPPAASADARTASNVVMTPTASGPLSIMSPTTTNTAAPRSRLPFVSITWAPVSSVASAYRVVAVNIAQRPQLGHAIELDDRGVRDPIANDRRRVGSIDGVGGIGVAD